eukprot:m.25193 g.25193  ORF g.25193 m.25193 type:complete len:244 (+) comp6170_c0_seq1:385-1116(+)
MLGALEIGMIVLALFVLFTVAAICAVYMRAKKQSARNDAVEIIAPPKTKHNGGNVRALRVNSHGTGYSSFGRSARPTGRGAGGRGQRGQPNGHLTGTAASLNSLKNLNDPSDADKMAALLKMRDMCESGVPPQEAEWDDMKPAIARPPSRAATATPAPPTNLPQRKSRAHLKAQIVFSDLDDDQDELLLDLEKPVSSEFPGFGVDRDAGKSMFDHVSVASSSSGGFSDSDDDSDRSATPTTLL